MSEMLLDRAGRSRSPATMPGFYPADPPKVEEIVAVMGKAGDNAHGRRLRGLIVVLWRAGLRIQEALALAVEMAREGVPLLVIQRQLGHSNLGRHRPTQARRSAARS